MYVPPRNDLAYSKERLEKLLSSRRLIFNPYKVSDEQLLEICQNADWGGENDLTDSVIVNFTKFRETGDARKFDGVYMTVGRDPEEVFIHASIFLYGVTANDSIRPERSYWNKKRICNHDDIKRLVGKRAFVSRRIQGVGINGNARVAYRMYRLWGDLRKDAAIIREAICFSKIEMLERVLEYPDCRHYLSCKKGFFDYEPRIRSAIEIIRNYPNCAVQANE